MEKLIVVVFDDNEQKALEGLRALRELDKAGEITLYDAQVVSWGLDGSVRAVPQDDNRTVPWAAGGGAVGALIGSLGGPIGLMIGAAAGALAGGIDAMEELEVTERFTQDVKAALTPRKTAVVAAIDEDLVKPVDERMEQIGGVVFRRPCSVLKTTEHDRDVAAHQLELQQRKVERQRARAERLAVIDAHIDKARTMLDATIERRRANMRATEEQREAKIKVLEAEAEQAEGEARQREEDRITKLRRDYEDMVVRLPDSKSSK